MAQHSVLVFAYYFPPMGLSGVQRVSKFVKYLPDNGWQPHVITTGPTAYYAHDPSLLEELEGRDIVIHRTSGADPNSLLKGKGTVKMPREWMRKIMRKASDTIFIPDNKRSWAKQALALARELVKEHTFDAIFVSGPPFSAMMAAAELSEETGIPLVVDYRDLWYGNQFHFYPTPWHAHRHQALEHDVLTHASRVTVTNRRLKERLIATYNHLNFEDVVILPHGFDPEDIPAPPPTKRNDGVFRLTYAGIFYDVVTPIPFFKAVKKVMSERKDVPIELHFAGLLREEYSKAAKKLGLSDVIHDHGYCAHEESVKLLMESDVLWMMVGNTRNADTISSAKLYEYFGTRKPLLVSVPNGALRKDAERYGASWITDPDDVEAIALCINEMIDAWKKGALPRPDESVVEQFNRTTLTSQLARQLALSTRVM
ncbi:MAG: glycosyltransferase [Ignavibacteria bacterium]|nr:glycosyltransferase [Ignavibacteria bacterium]MBP7092444.1 glycosyltransferase [Candidatus Kapabacteria bacterium]MBK6417690.1 glycosyltransferase [Ignavibacteria bacterium]MBK6760721.1 glycosyltransferase [Ignavibacteria bacterium]MBK7411198.1 glycosyltransferase [Ignavibacteria bacterium]